jgi:aspartate/methionine/tyrosine aminotransferase
LRDLRRPKERAAALFSARVRLAGEPVSPGQVAVVSNGTQALLLTLAALKERGARRLVIAAPCYYAAVRIAHLLSLEVCLVPARDALTGALDLPALSAAVRAPGSVLLVTNPAYSVGVEYSWAALCDLFTAVPDAVPVLLDETRLGLSWREPAPWYPADYPANVVVLRSPSKVFFLNGAKCSLLLAAAPLIRTIERTSEGVVGSTSGNLDGVTLAYLGAWERWQSETLAGQAGPLTSWRNGIVARLERNLSLMSLPLRRRGFSLSPVDSGPYALALLRHPKAQRLASVPIARATGVPLMDTSYFFHATGAPAFRLNLCADAERAQLGLSRVLTYLGSSSSSPAGAASYRAAPLRRNIET